MLSSPPARQPGPRDLRRFALTVGAAFGVLATVALARGRAALGLALAAAAGALLVAGMVVPGRLGPVYGAWMALALAMSRVTTPVFMGLVYYGLLTPIGFALRLVGRRPLRGPRPGGTAWVARPEGERRSDLRRQF
jgi:hypothetical protein